jgi:hypothetical protein
VVAQVTHQAANHRDRCDRSAMRSLNRLLNPTAA